MNLTLLVLNLLNFSPAIEGGGQLFASFEFWLLEDHFGILSDRSLDIHVTKKCTKNRVPYFFVVEKLPFSLKIEKPSNFAIWKKTFNPNMRHQN